MPPKRKSRKVGLKRMDAAIDALEPMGFSREVIRRKVRSLLQLYDGNQGWVFVEEAAYKLLIDSILEDQEDVLCEQGEPSCRDSPDDNECQDGFEAEPSEAGPSTEGGKSLCSNQDMGLASVIDAPFPSPVAVPEPTFTPIQSVMALSTEVNLRNQENVSDLSEDGMPSPLTGFDHRPPLQVEYNSKRKPCLGWIGPKDDNDFILFEPLRVLGWSTGERCRKQKSRWSVSSDDVV